MPFWAIAGPIISALVGGGASVAAARSQSRASQRGADLESKYLAEQLAFEKEKAAEDRRRFDETEARRRQEYDQTEATRKSEYDRTEAQAQAAWDAEEARKAPYRQAREAQLGQIANRLGLAFTPSTAPRVRPPGWTGPTASTGELPLSALMRMPSASARPDVPMNTTMPVAGGASLPRTDDMWLSELVKPRQRM